MDATADSAKKAPFLMRLILMLIALAVLSLTTFIGLWAANWAFVIPPISNHQLAQLSVGYVMIALLLSVLMY